MVRVASRPGIAPGVVLGVALACAPALARASTWQIDPNHSGGRFSVRHMMVSNVRGDISKVSGMVVLDEKDPSKSSVEATLDPSTVNTENAMRDQHLRSPDFFDVAKYPAITFKSTKVVKAGKDKYTVTGDLTLHGVTRKVILDVDAPSEVVKDMQGKVRRGASATTRVNRKDFGLLWNKVLEGGGVVIGDQVTIGLDIEMLQVEPGATAAK